MRITAGVVWPSMVIPTVRAPRSRTGPLPSRAIPTIAAAALSNTALAIGLRPEDVDDRVHHDDVALAHERAERPAPRGAGRDDQLRHADRERVHRRRAEQGALRATQAEHRLDPSLEPEPQAHRSHALEHQLHRGAAAPGRANPLEVVTAFARDLLAAHVGLGAGLAEDPRVDHDRARPERRQPLAHVGDLVALRVERADQRDAGRFRHARSRHSRVCTSTGAFWNSSSAAARCSAYRSYVRSPFSAVARIGFPITPLGVKSSWSVGNMKYW